MKKTKRILAAILAGCMLATITPAAGATSTVQPNISIVQLQDNVSELRFDGTDTYVQTHDLDNGNVEVTQYTDGDRTSQYIVDRLNHCIYATYYKNGLETGSQTIYVSDSEFFQPYGSTRGTLGNVRFQYFDSMNAGISTVTVTYEKETGNKTYNINGKYNDAAALISILSLVFNFPGFIASALANTIIKAIGTISTIGVLAIPDCNLKSEYTEITYLLKDKATNRTNSFFGTKYVITEAGKRFNEEYYEGTYYPTSSWGDPVFGNTIYDHMYAYSYWSIAGWD